MAIARASIAPADGRAAQALRPRAIPWAEPLAQVDKVNRAADDTPTFAVLRGRRPALPDLHWHPADLKRPNGHPSPKAP